MIAYDCADFKPNHSDSAQLFKILGPKRFSVLQAAFGGRKVWVPKAGNSTGCQSCGKRNSCIFIWRRTGVSAAAIAARVGLSTKTVYRVLRSRSAGSKSLL